MKGLFVNKKRNESKTETAKKIKEMNKKIFDELTVEELIQFYFKNGGKK